MTKRDDLDRIHRSLLMIAKQQPEYANNEVSAIWGYSEGAEHALDMVRAYCLVVVEDNERFTTRCCLPKGHAGKHGDTR